jgi:putative SOS response-associated peptidase YedK
MCGRYRLTRAERLAEQFDAEIAEDLHPRYNIAPTQPVPVVRTNGSRRAIAAKLSLNAGFSRSVSLRALICDIDGSFAQFGIKPHRIARVDQRRPFFKSVSNHEKRCSDLPDVACLRAFLALLRVVLNLVAFL